MKKKGKTADSADKRLPKRGRAGDPLPEPVASADDAAVDADPADIFADDDFADSDEVSAVDAAGATDADADADGLAQSQPAASGLESAGDGFFRYTVPPELGGQRADKVLATACAQFSRERLQELFAQEQVFLGAAGTKPLAKKTRLNAGDTLIFTLPQELETSVRPVAMALEILYEDEALVAVNKPVGLVVHPGAGVADQATLVHGMLAHCEGRLALAGGEQRPGIVHRLDRDTSGIIVLAKTDAAYYQLVKAFAERHTRKVYWALVRRAPAQDSGTIRLPIGRHPVQRHKMAVREDGRSAHTDWQVLERFSGGYALVQCRIHTGRTHQIRVHLSQMGCPIWGDATYGYRPLNKAEPLTSQFLLHARELELPHPLSGEPLQLLAEPSAYFAEKLAWLRERG